jgi:tetrahydromethanopterin S-methyltransferase subunit D
LFAVSAEIVAPAALKLVGAGALVYGSGCVPVGDDATVVVPIAAPAGESPVACAGEGASWPVKSARSVCTTRAASRCAGTR